MIDRTRHPAYALHAVVSLLDQAADSILPASGLTYGRYLMLVTIERLGGATQRSIADALGITEPAVSRTIRGLQGDGLVAASSTPGNGNRRSVSLTSTGQRVLHESAERLEGSFALLLEVVGLTVGDVLAVTDPLLEALRREEAP